MSRRKVFAGTASMTLSINVQDTSSTTGGGLGGLTNTTPGLVFEYRRQGESSWTNIPLVSGTLGSYLSGSIVANGALAGRYEIGIPNAAIASGARFVELQLRGAANMLPVLIEFELDAVNYQDAVGFGLSRLDATVGSRSTQTSVDTLLGRITAPVAQMFQDLIAMITGSGSVDAQFDAKALELGPGGGGGGAGDASQATLLQVKAKTDLIVAGLVRYTAMVNQNGEIDNDIVIGSDYLAANSRAFKWTVTAPAGYVVGTTVVRFGGRHVRAGVSSTWNVTGTAADNGDGTWDLSCDMTRIVSGALVAGLHHWSVDMVNAGGTEITPVKSGKLVNVVEKQT